MSLLEVSPFLNVQHCVKHFNNNNNNNNNNKGTEMASKNVSNFVAETVVMVKFKTTFTFTLYRMRYFS